MGSPQKTWTTIWAIYRDLLNGFEHLDDTPRFALKWDTHVRLMDLQPNDHNKSEQAAISLIPGRDLLGGIDHPRTDGSYYMGGANGGLGLGE